MRYLFFLFFFLVPVCVTAQEATWVSTDGPGFATPSSLVMDVQGRALIPAQGRTLALSLDGETWESYAPRPHLLAVIDEDHYVTADNFLQAGSGNSPPNEYDGTILLWDRGADDAEPVGQFRTDGFVEHALTSPDGDVWAGVQYYTGLDGDLGDPTGIAVAHLASEDVSTEPDAWSLFDLPDAAVELHALAWIPVLGLLAATDDGIYATADASGYRLGLAAESISDVITTSAGSLLASGESGHVFRSTDDGVTWEEAATLLGPINNLLAIENGVLAAVEEHGVFRSTDDGLTWMPTGLTSSATALVGRPTGPYHATGAGATLYRSEDGIAWAPKKYVDTAVGSLTFTPEGLVARASRLYRYAGATWEQVSPLSVSMFAVSPTTGAYYAAEVYDRQQQEPGNDLSRFYRSSDAGATWEQIRSFAGTPTGLVVTSAGTVLLGIFANESGSRIERLPEASSTWSTTNTIGSFYVRLQQGASGSVYAVGEFGYDVSTDDGRTWEPFSGPPFPAEGFQALLETSEEALLLSSCRGIFRSEDGGMTWTASDLALPTRPLASNSAGDLFTGTSQCFSSDPYYTGAFRSVDEGRTWEPYGLDDQPVYSLAVEADGVLVAGTNGGVYRTDQTTVVAEDGAKPPAAMAIYPNPVTRSATLTFSTASAGHVAVTVFDVLGRTVATLHNADTAPGSRDLQWTPAGQASGTYFVRIVTPSETRTLPVTVVR